VERECESWRSGIVIPEAGLVLASAAGLLQSPVGAFASAGPYHLGPGIDRRRHGGMSGMRAQRACMGITRRLVALLFHGSIPCGKSRAVEDEVDLWTRLDRGMAYLSRRSVDSLDVGLCVVDCRFAAWYGSALSEEVDHA
jgi:hypothetical protein